MKEYRKGHYLFGTSKMDENGQILVPTAAREKFDLSPGVSVVILGDERGMAIVRADLMKQMLDETGMGDFIEGEFLLGTSRLEEGGQIVLPTAARKKFDLNPGDTVIVIGEGTRKGLAIVKADLNNRIIAMLLDVLNLDVKHDHSGKFSGH